MFLGSYAINMDAKGRMAIPTKVRESLASFSGDHIIVTAHTEERCLSVYPESRWTEVLNAIEGLPNLNRTTRRIQRLIIGYATKLEMDANGRILVPPTLREFAGLEKKLMLVGQGKKFELWSEQGWANWLDEESPEAEIPAELKNLTL